MQYLFYVFALISIISALLVVSARSPINSVIALIVCFLSIAGHYVLLNAQFLAMVHVIVYTGAIMVLFLFIIMLLGLTAGDGPLPTGRLVVPATLAAATLVALFALIGADPTGARLLPAAMATPAAENALRGLIRAKASRPQPMAISAAHHSRWTTPGRSARFHASSGPAGRIRKATAISGTKVAAK